VAAALLSQPAVKGVQVLGVLGRVAVAFDPELTSVDDLVDVVEAVEDEMGVADELFPADRPEHPGDTEPAQRDVFALGADGVALALVGLGRAAQLARLPSEVAGFVLFAQSQPRVKHTLAAALGPGPADMVLAATGATSQALVQGPLGVIVDGTYRTCLALESRARMASWHKYGPSLIHGRPEPEIHDTPHRPAPLPDGPVEHYERQALIAAPGAFAAVGLLTRNLRRASGAILATNPRAAPMGREVFAAHLGRTLADREVLTMDRRSLRRLDRIDVILLDGTTLSGGTMEIRRVVPLAGFDQAEVSARLRALFRPSRPRSRRQAAGARLEPVAHDDARTAVQRAIRELGDGADRLLLTIGDAPAAVVALGRGCPPGAATLAQVARRAGHMVAVAGDKALSQQLRADMYLDGGERLTSSVHLLQRDGCVVLLVSRRSRALAAADVGLGVVAAGRQVPWGADILVQEWEQARFLIEASGVAHEVSRQSAALALTGSGIGSIAVLGGPAGRASDRAMTAVNTAALFAVVNGTRAAVGLARRPPAPVRQPVAWHELTVDEALERVDSRREGLTDAEAAERTKPENGRPPVPSFIRAMATELANPLTPVLAGASVLAASVGSVTDAALVAGVAGANATLGAVQRLHVEQAVQALEHDNRQHVWVRRDGEVRVIGAAELVCGDVVLLDADRLVPADCRIVKATALEVDESALTGESLPVAKGEEPVLAASPADRSSMLYAGTAIAAGTCEALVVAVGADTEAAAAGVGQSNSTGGVEARLRDLTRVSLPVSLIGGAGVAFSGLLRGLPPAAAAQTGVGLAVAAVPEGLPALATVAQLASARRLGHQGALVRNARAVEALGRVQVLCTDKTGTMTQGRIELALVSDGEHAVPLDEAGPRQAAIVSAAVAASPRERPGRPLRHLTDRAIVAAAPAWGVDLEEHAHRQQDLPFEPGRGYHAAVERNGNGVWLCVKGAPEKLLPRCSTWLRNGDAAVEVPIDRRRRRAVDAHVEGLASRGYRVLAVAQRPSSGRHDLDDERVRDLTLIGFLALADPVRPSAAVAASALRDAGVHIVMVTGDHPSTAQGIAEELGILESGAVVTGATLAGMDDAALEERLDTVSVFARVTPADKVRIVEAYRRQGRVVAMAGDGANDAAAIRLADVGVALGENATSAARSGADVVVPDGRVETLIDAIVEGRSMWSSVREAVALLLGGNLGEVGFILTTALLTGRSPLTARQLLLVNLLTDTVPALAIAVRPPEVGMADAWLREGPDASLGRSLEHAIFVRGGATAAAATVSWLGARLTGQGPRAPTVTLVGLVGAQLGQTVVAGGRDPRVLAAGLGSAVVMGAIISTPGVSQMFGCQPLGPSGWAIGLGGAAFGTATAVLVPRLVDWASGQPGLVAAVG
jgi:cation-transporting ATPase I